MATATHAAQDATGANLAGRRDIVLRPRKYPGLLAFATAWLAFTVVFDVYFLPRFFANTPLLSLGTLFLVVWAGIWHLVWLLVLYGLLWTLFGRECITLDEHQMTRRREVFVPGRTERLDRERIANVRVDPIRHSPWRHEPPSVTWVQGGVSPTGVGVNVQTFYPWKEFFGIGEGFVAYEYDGQTRRLGVSIDEAEASRVAEQLAGWAGPNGR
jgi:hypothetical protein